MKELLIAGGLRADENGRTRDAKSLRQTGISLRLDLGPHPDYRDIAKWARTCGWRIADFLSILEFATHSHRGSERASIRRNGRCRRVRQGI